MYNALAYVASHDLVLAYIVVWKCFKQILLHSLRPSNTYMRLNLVSNGDDNGLVVTWHKDITKCEMLSTGS